MRWIIGGNAAVAVLVCGWFLVYPAVRAGLDLLDPAWQRPGVPKLAWRLAQNLTPRYATWARERVAQGRAETLSIRDISGTEWPLFGSVFYLWGIENLQTAWDGGDHRSAIPPKDFGRDAIVAASELVIDPKHAAWVRKHWGDDHLHRENVFYRMLVIAALTSRANLLRDGAHLELLRDQVETLAQELDVSPTGLLDDYPGECYPGDVMAALMCIQRADAVLGTDHGGFIQRAVRAFTGDRVTRHHLPPYAANSRTGRPVSDARGCANSYLCLTAPELWPAQARRWFELYDRFFWQERLTAVGYREYPETAHMAEWTMDVDAGPVISGHGVSASAFGVGAARKHGRFDRAYPLAAELTSTLGELPNGVLAVPRLLSNLSDAPLLGEAAILWLVTTAPQAGFPVKTGGQLPTYVLVVLGTAFLLGTWGVVRALQTVRLVRRTAPVIRAPRFQTCLWAGLMAGAAIAAVAGHGHLGFGFLVAGIVLPVGKRKLPVDEYRDWPEAQASSTAAPGTGSGA